MVPCSKIRYPPCRNRMSGRSGGHHACAPARLLPRRLRKPRHQRRGGTAAHHPARGQQGDPEAGGRSRRRAVRTAARRGGADTLCRHPGPARQADGHPVPPCAGRDRRRPRRVRGADPHRRGAGLVQLLPAADPRPLRQPPPPCPLLAARGRDRHADPRPDRRRDRHRLRLARLPEPRRDRARADHRPAPCGRGRRQPSAGGPRRCRARGAGAVSLGHAGRRSRRHRAHLVILRRPWLPAAADRGRILLAKRDPGAGRGRTLPRPTCPR
ncbi:MAG: hypothetical protein KatS3mg118_1187 [Paracoccaceae bacterium]|nr:MAG: hypothetical protein KatS3mg118_1187 [Paracoccaceae bacterium]